MDSLALLKVLSLIGAMLALLYLAFKMTKKMPNWRPSSTNKLIAVLEYQRIDQKNSVCIVKVGNQCFLLALGCEAICLEKIPDLE